MIFYTPDFVSRIFREHVHSFHRHACALSRGIYLDLFLLEQVIFYHYQSKNIYQGSEWVIF